MSTEFVPEHRSKEIILYEPLKVWMDIYKQAFKGDIVRDAANEEQALAWLFKHFNQGTILVLGGNASYRADLLSILDLAVRQAQNNHFMPTIYANTDDLVLNRELLNKGCTYSSPNKKSLVESIKEHGMSKVTRSLRGIGMR